MPEYNDQPPPPPVPPMPEGDLVDVLEPEAMTIGLARDICERGHLRDDMIPLLQQMTALVAASPNASAKVISQLIDRMLPPGPSRAESWWLKCAPRDQWGDNATMEDIARWLADTVKAGGVSPAVAAELIGHFKVLDAAGGFTQPRIVEPGMARTPRSKNLRSVR